MDMLRTLYVPNAMSELFEHRLVNIYAIRQCPITCIPVGRFNDGPTTSYGGPTAIPRRSDDVLAGIAILVNVVPSGDEFEHVQAANRIIMTHCN